MMRVKGRLRGVCFLVLGLGLPCQPVILCAQALTCQVAVNADGVALTCNTEAGRHYVVEHAEVLASETLWIPQETFVAAAEQRVLMVTNTPFRYFRVRSYDNAIAIARTRWAGFAITNYEMILTRRAATAMGLRDEVVHAAVSNGALRSSIVYHPRDSRAWYRPGASQSNLLLTVSQWFDIIETALADPLGVVTFDTHPTEHYPTRFRYTPSWTNGKPLYDMNLRVIDRQHHSVALRLREAEARWRASHIKSWRARAQTWRQVALAGDRQVPIRYEVNQGVASQPVWDDTGALVPEDPIIDQDLRPADLFAMVRSLMRPERRLSVRFCPHTGVPSDIGADFHTEYIIYEDVVLESQVIDGGAGYEFEFLSYAR